MGRILFHWFDLIWYWGMKHFSFFDNEISITLPLMHSLWDRIHIVNPTSLHSISKFLEVWNGLCGITSLVFTSTRQQSALRARRRCTQMCCTIPYVLNWPNLSFPHLGPDLRGPIPKTLIRAFRLLRKVHRLPQVVVCKFHMFCGPEKMKSLFKKH